MRGGTRWADKDKINMDGKWVTLYKMHTYSRTIEEVKALEKAKTYAMLMGDEHIKEHFELVSKDDVDTKLGQYFTTREAAQAALVDYYVRQISRLYNRIRSDQFDLKYDMKMLAELDPAKAQEMREALEVIDD